ncbi:MAG: hypothetical protein AAFX85_17525, partial [Pseudomonadota bacterium]
MRIHALITSLMLAILLGLSACGGGGDDAAADVPAPPPQGSPPPDDDAEETTTLAIEAPTQAVVSEGETKAFDFTISGADGADVSVALTGDDAGMFRIEGDSVFFIDAPDFETPGPGGNELELSLEASANDQSAQAAVSVTVANLLEGRNIDGPVANAIVFVDLDNDGVQDLEEPSTTSDENGFVTIPRFTANGARTTIVATDGVDTFTGERLSDFTMRASVLSDTTAVFNLTPLSTLTARTMDQDAELQLLLASLGVEGDADALISTDIWASAQAGDASANTLVGVAQQLAFTLQGLGLDVLATDVDPRDAAVWLEALESAITSQLAIDATVLHSATGLQAAVTEALAAAPVAGLS